ncbi:carbohydrate ABC transporter permease [Blautia sp.]|uniref:carbohydrate ABC transporter permease n=1 Tax=Blautia sp. TaxID=1955243 RepID=UPI0015A0607A|nr:sugar ABC transporter permease [Blautia sp.]
MNIERGERTLNFKLRKFLNKESSAGVVFCMPFIIGFLVFLIIPMGMSLYYSFCDYDILSPPVFTGLDNYIEIFTADETFWHSVKATFLFAFVSVPLRLIFALIVALILVKSTKATGFYRAAYYLPSILGGSVAVAVLWRRIFATDGVLNSILGMFGLDTQFAWLGNTKTAIWTLVLLAIWQFGSSMLIFLSALKQIPRDLYEAADVDGANKFVKFFKITLPLLTPTIFFNLVMQMINGFLAFTQSLIITDGKPMDSTLFYAVYMYRQAFSFNHAGYASAMAWIMLLFIGLLTLLLFKTKKYWVYEQE